MAFYRVIKTGNIVELYKYQTIKQLQYEKKLETETNENEKENNLDRVEKTELAKKQSAYRSRQKVRRLILNNFSEGDTFITLTFAENMTDIKKANYELKKFIQKMQRKVSDFKHVTVIEFQKRGAVHYHMICNYQLEFDTTDIEKRKAHERFLFGEVIDGEYMGGKLWKNGIGSIHDIKHVDNVGAYVIKYMTKGTRDDRLFQQKSYFRGGKLITPVEITDPNEIKLWVDTLEGSIPCFTSDYSTEYQGQINYKEYNLKRMEK